MSEMKNDSFEPELLVGAGKAVIEIPEAYLAAENFKTIHDPIHARAVAIAGNETVLLVSLEITSMPEPEIRCIREQIADRTGVPKENIWV
ncbi:MAG: hypothetical protein LUI13_07025 [Lachnospiraceae bacterium]|nr:hypothetical protein [Lachnospiraceae bacterium]